MRDNADGTADVLRAGNPLVSGTTARALQVTGSIQLDGAGTVRVEWPHRPGVSAGMESGELAAVVSLLAPADAGGALVQTTAGYDDFGRQVADQVNALHTGAGKGAFFAYQPERAAASLTVLPTLGADVPEAHLFVVATPGPGGTTVNLAAPIVLDPETGRCAQLILEGQGYPLRAALAQAA